MKKIIIILSLFFLCSCCGYESFNVRYEVTGDTLAADILYNTKDDDTPTEVEIYDASLPWDYSYIANLYYNIDDDLYEEYTAEAVAIKTTDDSGLITLKLYIDDELVDEDSTSAPYGRVRVYQTFSSEDSF